ncbi:MAG: hypothetical protein U9R21_05730 [Candidatus Thermoplasmatota archaeon]|nr:hypothetical protein [Candidatus Thermoplasmatota archaeon]
MSNKIKIKNVKYEKIKTPVKIRFQQYLADLAGCGYIRVIYPSLLLNQMINKDIQVESFYTNRFTPHPDGYQNTSFVVFQRAATEQQLQMIRHLKTNMKGLPILYEIDDSLIDIPEWNFASEFYKPLESNIKEILRTVDGIITSTEYLKKKYLKYNKNIQVISNHLPKFIWGDVVECKSKDIQHPRIVYSGSFNHFKQEGSGGDFHKDLIKFISDTTEKYDWIFVGGVPYELRNDPGVTIYPWKSVMEFPSFIKSLNADIMLAPLEDNDFNCCKSNIKALEAVACGIPLICSNIEPYKNLTCKCDTPDWMIHQIEMLAANPNIRRDVWKSDYNTLKTQLYWEENGNLLDYINKYLKLVGKRL